MAGGKRPLCNMCPTVVLREDGFDFALGASGGRRIMPAVMQNLSLLVDCKLSLPEAIHHPRIDVSGGETANVDTRLPQQVVDAVSDVLPVVSVEDSVFPSNFACPNGVADLTYTKVAQSYPKFPMSGAAGA